MGGNRGICQFLFFSGGSDPAEDSSRSGSSLGGVWLPHRRHAGGGGKCDCRRGCRLLFGHGSAESAIISVGIRTAGAAGQQILNAGEWRQGHPGAGALATGGNYLFTGFIFAAGVESLAAVVSFWVIPCLGCQ